MTQLGNATFIQANQSGWNPATDGQNWSVQSGAATLSISSNEGLATGVTALTYIELGTLTSGDGEILCRMSGSSTNYTALGLILRATGTTTFYRARINTNTSAQGIGIVKTVSGTTTNLVTASFTASINTFYFLRFRLVGSTMWVKVWADGSAEPDAFTVTVTDSSITGVGGFGICVNTSSSGDTAKFDSFYAVDYIWADSIPASDVSGGTLRSWNVDSLTATDITLAGDSYLPIDGLSAVDVPLVTDGYVPIDVVAVSDVGNMQRWTIDSLSASDIFSVVDAALLVDALVAVDSLLQTDSYSALDALVATDTFVPSDMLVATDALIASDVGNMQAWPVDALVATGAFAGADVLTSVDALVASDTLLDTQSVFAVDVLSAGDGFVGADVLTSVDTFPARDTFVCADVLVSSDVLSMSDGFSTSDTVQFTDQVSVSDSSFSTDGFAVVENYLVSDAAQYRDRYVPIESLPVSEIALVTDGYTVVDVLSVSDRTQYNDAFLPIVSYSNLVILGGPVVYYRLDEVSGTVAHDTFNHYDGMLPSSGITYSQPGAIVGDSDTSMLFGSSSTLSLPYTLNPSTFTSLSLAFWIKLTSGWQRIAVTCDGTNTILYLNGVVYTGGSGDVVVIDSNFAYAGSYQAGGLDEVTVYDYVLTPAQEFALYQVGLAMLPSTDVIPISETVQYAALSAFLEGLSISEVIAYLLSYSGSDNALSASDSILSSDGYVPSDSALSVVDSTIAQDNYSTTDALVVSDMQSTNSVTNWIESIPVAESLLASDVALWLESLSVSDTATLAGVAAFIEALIALDTWLNQDNVSIVESAPVSDGFVGSGPFVPVEVLSITESISYIRSLLAVEPLRAQDMLLAFDGVSWLDALSASDLFTWFQSVPQDIIPFVMQAIFRDNLIIATFRDGVTLGSERDGIVAATYR